MLEFYHLSTQTLCIRCAQQLCCVRCGAIGRLLTSMFHTTRTKMTWQCANEHIWQTTGDKIKNRGAWCLVCAHVARKSIFEMQLVAIGRGGNCLSLEYINSKTPLLWQCAEGHTWHAQPNTITAGGRWCPHCAQKFPKDIHYMQSLAAKFGGECLDDVAHGMQNEHRWRCKEGHLFSMKPNNVKYGHWCGKCWSVRRVGLKRRKVEA